jgi:hypothetical protein
MDGLDGEETGKQIISLEANVDVMGEHGEEGGSSGVHANLSDLVGKNCEFLLERGRVISFLNFHFEFAGVGVFANGYNEHHS